MSAAIIRRIQAAREVQLVESAISGYISGKDRAMSAPQKKALLAHRRRLKRHGFKRLEVRVRKGDAALIRGVAQALTDPAREAVTRALLQKQFGGGPAQGLKALLAAAPLDGINLSRERDAARDVAL
jgi:hypothetical protein